MVVDKWLEDVRQGELFSLSPSHKTLVFNLMFPKKTLVFKVFSHVVWYIKQIRGFTYIIIIYIYKGRIYIYIYINIYGVQCLMKPYQQYYALSAGLWSHVSHLPYFIPSFFCYFIFIIIRMMKTLVLVWPHCSNIKFRFLQYILGI